jgi:hypothetical protein
LDWYLNKPCTALTPRNISTESAKADWLLSSDETVAQRSSNTKKIITYQMLAGLPNPEKEGLPDP